MTLAEFLLARIAEDEAVARLIHAEADRAGVWYCDGAGGDILGTGRVDGARMLAECEAKRRIKELHDHPEGACWEMHRGFVAPDWKPEWDGRNPGEPWAHPSLEGPEVHPGPCETLQLLALPYGDHPDYRAEWAPETAESAPTRPRR